MREILYDLPSEHRTTLDFLAAFLLRVANAVEETKMNVSNLATVFAPTLMWKKSLDRDMQLANAALEVRFLACLLQDRASASVCVPSL